MSFFEDLSPYTYHSYVHSPDNKSIVNVGWLDLNRSFSQGIVEPAIVAHIGKLCRRPVNLMRGFHGCQACPEYPIKEAYLGDGELRSLGNGEIRIEGPERTYSSPTLIYHYILRHKYLPP